MHLFRPLLALIALALVYGATPVSAGRVNVFAAASLKTALDEIGSAWKAETGKETALVYAGTPALARQIAEGAPADLFISADNDWMDELEARGLIVTQTRRNLLGNTLVLIAPASATVAVDFTGPVDLAGLLAGERLALANVKTVPAGRYAKAALESLNQWSAIENALAQTDNVRMALSLVARGETPLGIVYGSDATAEPKVRVVAEFPKETHPPITYPVALVTNAPNPDAPQFLAYLASPRATAIFSRNGFSLAQ